MKKPIRIPTGTTRTLRTNESANVIVEILVGMVLLAIMAMGLTAGPGFEPALHTSARSPPRVAANPSAIWLRHEFSTQTNSTVGFTGKF